MPRLRHKGGGGGSVRAAAVTAQSPVCPRVPLIPFLCWPPPRWSRHPKHDAAAAAKLARGYEASKHSTGTLAEASARAAAAILPKPKPVIPEGVDPRALEEGEAVIRLRSEPRPVGEALAHRIAQAKHKGDPLHRDIDSLKAVRAQKTLVTDAAATEITKLNTKLEQYMAHVAARTKARVADQARRALKMGALPGDLLREQELLEADLAEEKEDLVGEKELHQDIVAAEKRRITANEEKMEIEQKLYQVLLLEKDRQEVLSYLQGLDWADKEAQIRELTAQKEALMARKAEREQESLKLAAEKKSLLAQKASLQAQKDKQLKELKELKELKKANAAKLKRAGQAPEPEPEPEQPLAPATTTRPAGKGNEEFLAFAHTQDQQLSDPVAQLLKNSDPSKGVVRGSVTYDLMKATDFKGWIAPCVASGFTRDNYCDGMGEPVPFETDRQRVCKCDCEAGYEGSKHGGPGCAKEAATSAAEAFWPGGCRPAALGAMTRGNYCSNHGSPFSYEDSHAAHLVCTCKCDAGYYGQDDGGPGCKSHEWPGGCKPTKLGLMTRADYCDNLGTPISYKDSHTGDKVCTCHCDDGYEGKDAGGAGCTKKEDLPTAERRSNEPCKDAARTRANYCDGHGTPAVVEAAGAEDTTTWKSCTCDCDAGYTQHQPFGGGCTIDSSYTAGEEKALEIVSKWSKEAKRQADATDAANPSGAGEAQDGAKVGKRKKKRKDRRVNIVGQPLTSEQADRLRDAEARKAAVARKLREQQDLLQKQSQDIIKNTDKIKNLKETHAERVMVLKEAIEEKKKLVDTARLRAQTG